MGVYRANIKVYDHTKKAWVTKNTPSTMFPDHWSRDEVMRAVKSATNDPSRQVIGSNKFIGVDQQTGMKIIFTTNANNELTTAYPDL